MATAISANFENTDFANNSNPGCGDGIIDNASGAFGDLGEECDDGNRIDEPCN